jgi:hypothetical protein
MQTNETEGKSLGLIFDLSIRHAKNGKRIVDIVKKKMIDIVRSLLIDGEDSLYLYHPELTEASIKHGEQVFAIGNYDTDGWKMNLNFALKQTLYVLLGEDYTFSKYLILVTDRIDNEKSLIKAFDINQKENINCNFIIVGIGKFYDTNALKRFSDSASNVNYIHLNDAEELTDKLFKEIINGKDAYSETDEQRECVQLSSGHRCSVPRTVRHVDAIDAESVSVNEEQLLSTDFSRRLFSESGLHHEHRTECTEEFEPNSSGECCKNHTE